MKIKIIKRYILPNGIIIQICKNKSLLWWQPATNTFTFDQNIPTSRIIAFISQYIPALAVELSKTA